MMRCEYVKKTVEKLLHGAVSDEEMSSIRQHAEKCADCRKHFRTARNIRSALDKQHSGDYEVPRNVLSSFRQRLIKKTDSRQKFSGFFRIIASTVAVVLLLTSLLIYFTKTDDTEKFPPESRVTSFRVDEEQPLTIYLDYLAQRPFEEVTFRISLDENIHFDSEYPEIKSRKHHSWKGSLEMGSNEIPFTIVMDGNRQQTIRASARAGDSFYEHVIVLSPESGGKVKITRISLPVRELHETG
ncbi:MAG: hypothetical protein R6W70_09915 [bacterium]